MPLVVFKREKEVARSLEFDGMWIAEQPSDEDIKGLWDKLAISTRSFPDKYWDKFVKKKVSSSNKLSHHRSKLSSRNQLTIFLNRKKLRFTFSICDNKKISPQFYQMY